MIGSNMDYKIVFDVSEGQFQWWPSIGGITSILICAFIIVIDRMQIRKQGTSYIPSKIRIFGYGGILISIAWLFSFGIIPYRQYQECQYLLQTGVFSIVEGRVEHFQPGSGAQGQPPERFDVQNVKFEYKDNPVDCGFSQTSGQGGPVKNGLYVKISYIPRDPNTILRLEIKKNS